MKFTSVPKKLVLTGLSAAMVVAFAPAVAPELASAAVTQKDATETAQPAKDNSQVVAEVSWTNGNKTTTTPQQFKSDETYTDDDALQAALSFASQKSAEDNVKNVTVKLIKDVTVTDVNDDKANANLSDRDGLIASGKVTIDLNGHTVDNGWAGKIKDSKGTEHATNDTQVLTVRAQKYDITKTQDVTPKAQVVYATGDVQGLYEAWANAKDQNEKDTAETKFENAVISVDANGKAAKLNPAKIDAPNGFKAAQSNPGTRYFKDDNGFVNTVGQNTTVTGDKPFYAQYTITPNKVTQTTTKTVNPAGDVTVVNGTVRSNTQKEAIVVRGGTLTLGSKSNVTTNKAKVAVDANKASQVNLVDGTNVTATVNDAADNNNDSFAGTPGDKSSVTAVRAGEIVIGHNGKQDDHAYANTQATVNATLSNGQDGNTARALFSWNDVTAYETANVTAAATPKDEKHADITNRITGIIDHNDDMEANTVFSAAVVARDQAKLHYGNYKGDFAVISGYKLQSVTNKDTTVETKYVVDGKNAGFIKDGTYDGYVWNAANTDITGGKFLYDPTREFVSRVGEQEFQVQSATKLGRVDGAPNGLYRAATNSANGYTYVYRLGYADLSYAAVNGAHSSNDYMAVGVPEGAKDASGKEYNKVYNDPLTAYVQDKFLDQATQQLVFSEKGEGRELNDGNSFEKTRGIEQPTVNVSIVARYVTPTADAAKEAGYADAQAKLAEQAKANTQTAQGIYVLSAQEKYGFQKAAKGEKADSNGFKIVEGDFVDADFGAALTNLGDAKLAVKADLVTSYADAQAYKLGDKVEKIDLALPEAVGSTIYGYGTFQTADMGTYGITVTSVKNATDKAAADAQAKADAAKAEADKAAAEAQAKAEAAQKAAEDAKAQAEKDAAAAQKRADELAQQAAAAQKAADEAKAQLANEKAVNKVKNTKVKGLKVKAGKKKATVSWKKAKGYKYQVKYRQKNSSKTSDFKYAKTSKTSYVAKKLKSGKYYNFKVRVYKKVNGKTVYGKYTSIVTGKIK